MVAGLFRQGAKVIDFNDNRCEDSVDFIIVFPNENVE